MSRGVWSLARVGGIALCACGFLAGCSDVPDVNAGSSNGAVKSAREGRLSLAEANKKKGDEFLAANAKKEGVKTLPSGLQYLVLKEGTGKKPGPTDMVTVHYHGTLIDGTVFDSSVDRNEPITHPVNGFVEGWKQALPMMTEGSKWRLFVPSKLAYGQRGAGGKIGPNETLIFEMELLKVN
jgi:FKBP-type peptidyl-prolyl cis-trans isomerase FklB